MDERKYKIRWKINPPEYSETGFTKEEIGSDACGCDAFIYFSILDVDGGVSTTFTGMDGRSGKGENISDLEVWKAWVKIAYDLSNSQTLSETKKAFCREVFEMTRRSLLAVRAENEK